MMATQTREKEQEVAERKAGSSIVIHEVIRREGEEELERPAMSLLLSGITAGIAMGTSLLAAAHLRMGLPDAPWRHIVEALAYPIGFVIVIMGRLQLFTESNVTAVFPLAAEPGWLRLRQLLRLWGLVFAANMIGTFAVALLLRHGLLLDAAGQRALLEIAGEVAGRDFLHTMALSIPAGFLVGAIAWILPNARENQFWVIFVIAYLIGLGHFSHVVIGSIEAWLVWLSGGQSLSLAVGDQILPALIGNMIGGSGLFALLSHGQVRDELGDEAPSGDVRE